MTDVATRRRPRRIAADEAHAWARNLRLANPYAKLVLSMLTLYVNHEGSCFVSSSALAEDCELAIETVRRRLAWLETVGAIARFPQWIDDVGRRNGDGRGRRTTDDIRLLISADPEEIEARARGNGVDEPDAAPLPDRGSDRRVSPLPERGANDAGPPVSPLLAPSLRRGPESSEPEPEDSPQSPPSGGVRAEEVDDDKEGSEPIEGWEAFRAAFQADGEPIVRVSLSRTLFAGLSPAERERAARAASGMIEWRRRQRKPPTKPSAQTFLREIDAWSSWEVHAPAAPVEREPPTFVAEGSTAWEALRVIAAIADHPPPRARHVEGHGTGIMTSRPMSPAKLALAQFAGEPGAPIDQSAWPIVEQGTQACGAWRAFLGIEPRNVWTGETKRYVVAGIVHEHWKVFVTGLCVPCEWPPRKDGSLGSSEGVGE